MSDEDKIFLSDLFDEALGAPEIMVDCIRFLRQHGLDTVGLFRTSTDEIAYKVTHVRLRSDTINNTRGKKQLFNISNAGTAPNTPVSSLVAAATPVSISCVPHRRPSLTIALERDESIPSISELSDVSLLDPVDSSSETGSECGSEYSPVVVRDVGNVASVLKMFLTDLQEPLVTFHAYSRILAFTTALNANKITIGEWIDDVTGALESMPVPHKTTFFYLINFLSEVARNSLVNKMTPSNLAVIFAPALMRNPDESHLPTVQLMEEAKLTHKVLERIIVELGSNV